MADFFQSFQDLIQYAVQPHSPTTQATIAIIVTLGLLGCVASVFVRPMLEDEPQTDWLYTEMPSPTAHAESNQGGKVTLGGGVHVADSFSSVVVEPE